MAATAPVPDPEAGTIFEIRTGSKFLFQNSPVFAAASIVHVPVPELNTLTCLSLALYHSPLIVLLSIAPVAPLVVPVTVFPIANPTVRSSD